MRYCQLRKIEATGKWHYTCLRDEIITPIGACREHEGHETEAEAVGCYGKYVLDNQLRLDGKSSNSQHQCKECGAWTQGFAEILPMTVIVLCDEHRTRRIVEKHWQPPAAFIGS